MRHVPMIAAASLVDEDRVVAVIEEATWFVHDHAVTGCFCPTPSGDPVIRRAVGRAVVLALEQSEMVNGGRIMAAWQLAWRAIDAIEPPIDTKPR